MSTTGLVIRSAAAGLALGAGWGVLARLWMRAISTDPSFSWSGTLFIVGLFAGVGLLTGLVRGLRVAGRSRWAKLLLVPTLLGFAGQGLLLLPGTLLGGWAIGGRGPRPLRLAALAVAALGPPITLWVLTGEVERSVLAWPAAVGGGVLVQGLLAWGLAEVWRPHRARAASGLEPAPRPAGEVVERGGVAPVG